MKDTLSPIYKNLSDLLDLKSIWEKIIEILIPPDRKRQSKDKLVHNL